MIPFFLSLPFIPFLLLVRLTNTIASVTVGKNCSSLLSCITPNNVETEWSVNQGFKKEAHTQKCCTTDNCNLGTLAGKI